LKRAMRPVEAADAAGPSRAVTAIQARRIRNAPAAATETSSATSATSAIVVTEARVVTAATADAGTPLAGADPVNRHGPGTACGFSPRLRQASHSGKSRT